MLAAIAKASAAADGAAAPAGGAASSDALPDPEVLHDRKHELKLKMKQWELDYEEAHGGLVPTHDDKKEDAAYRALKQQAKQLEAAMELSKATVKAAKSKSLARQPGLLGALNLAMGKSPSRLNLAEGDEGMLGLEAATADEFEEPVRVRVDQVALLTVLRCASAAAAQFGAILRRPVSARALRGFRRPLLVPGRDGRRRLARRVGLPLPHLLRRFLAAGGSVRRLLDVGSLLARRVVLGGRRARLAPARLPLGHRRHPAARHGETRARSSSSCC